MKNNIALIGMMGTYKSTVGRQLADTLDMHFLDCDSMLEYEMQMPINHIFDTMGEKFFRKQEAKLLLRICGYTNTVISCGGGSVLHSDPMKDLSKSAIVILLTASPQIIYNRLLNDSTRPLLKDMTIKSISKIYSARRRIYLKYCDKIIDTDNKTSNEVSDEIINYLIKLANK